MSIVVEIRQTGSYCISGTQLCSAAATLPILPTAVETVLYGPLGSRNYLSLSFCPVLSRSYHYLLLHFAYTIPVLKEQHCIVQP